MTSKKKYPDDFCNSNCQNKRNCKLAAKFRRVIRDIHGYDFRLFLARKDEIKISCFRDSSSLAIIVISCETVEMHTEEQLRKLIFSFDQSEDNSQSEDFNQLEEDEDIENEDNSLESLSREEKIEMLSKILDEGYEIEIVQNSEINAYAKDNKIFIYSGALDVLDLDELAFVIAHECAHLEACHSAKKEKLIREVAHNIAQTVQGQGNFLQKTLSILGISAVGFASNIVLSHTNEIEADLKAKQKLRDAGFGEDGGKKLFNRIKEGPTLSHPASKLRLDILENI